MQLTLINEVYGEPVVLATEGLVIGLLFGFFAQRSKFCLRAAVIEFWHYQFGEKLAVWLLTFSVAVIVIQGLIIGSALDVNNARQLATRGSLSGALMGGLLFGAGVTGGALFATTAWLALVGMWMGAGLVDRWLDAPPISSPSLVQP